MGQELTFRGIAAGIVDLFLLKYARKKRCETFLKIDTSPQ